MTKFENLTRRAKSIIFEIFSDGPLTRGAALDALEDVKEDATSIEAAREYISSINAEAKLSLYCVEDAIKDADPFQYDEATCNKLLNCYEDSFDLGLFAADADAHNAAEMRQALDDAKAEKILASELENAALENGPAYCAHLFKYTENGLEPVELKANEDTATEVALKEMEGTTGWNEYAPWSDSPMVFGWGIALTRAQARASLNGGKIRVIKKEEIQGAVTHYILYAGDRKVASRVKYNY